MRAILTYHSIDASGSVLSVHPEVFRRHVRWLISDDVRVVPLEEICGAPMDADAVALTFDDGFENFGTVAWPTLREHGLRATLFVVTGHVGRTNSWGSHGHHRIPKLQLLGWEALGRLAEEGVGLGSHTCSHPDLSRIAESCLEDEVGGSAERIREYTGVWPRSFAYPFGRSNDRVVRAVGRTYERACSTELRPLEDREPAHDLPRIDMFYFRSPMRLTEWGTGRFRRYLRFRGQLRRLRARLERRGGER